MSNFIKVNKTKAKNLYNKGINVYIVPFKVYPNYNNMWIQPIMINNFTNENFDSRVNNFEYYNCNYELGYYTSFYIAEDEKE